MKRKIIIILSTLLIVSACNYKPIYNSPELKDINYKFIEEKGDSQINKIIIKNLRQNNVKKDGAKIIEIKLNSQFNKTVLAKDKFGSATDYKLSITSTFEVDNNDESLTFIISEDFVYKNLQENYEQSNYESSIKKNLAEQISEKLRTKLLTY